MKKYIALTLVFTLLLAGCNTVPLSEQQLNKIKSVAIVNNFPQYPSYSLVGTTVFQNEYGSIKDKDYQAELSNVFAGYFGKKNYKSVTIHDNAKEVSPETDLIVTLEPAGLGLAGTPNQAGYGLYQKSFFGFSDAPFTYIEMNVFAKLASGEKFNTHSHDSTFISFKKLTKEWNDLSNFKKNEIANKIRKNIKKSANSSMRDLGL